MEEKTYIIPLRREYLKAAYYERSKRAMSALFAYLKKHTKAKTILIGPQLNESIWEKGIRNPPHKVKVTATIDKDVAKVELFGHKYPEPIKQVEKSPEGLKEKVQAAFKPEEKTEKKVEDKQAEEKKEVKKSAQKAEKKTTPKKAAEKKSQ